MPRKPTVYKPPSDPRLTPFNKDAAYALQAMARGEASDKQQKFVLRWLIEAVCQTYDEPFMPGHADVTQYRLGKRGVGLAMVKHLNLSPAKLAGEGSTGD